MYKSVGIRIVLVKIITWSDEDKAHVAYRMDEAYVNFKKYVGKAKEIPAEKDSVVLLSYVQSCM